VHRGFQTGLAIYQKLLRKLSRQIEINQALQLGAVSGQEPIYHIQALPERLILPFALLLIGP
jgi:hypothetical protein